MNMKFYYNGKLIRTSKTHEYKYALVNKNSLQAYRCSKDMKGIEAAKSEIARDLNLLLSVKNGTYKRKDRWSSTAKEIEEQFIKWYGSMENAIDHNRKYCEQFMVVELEAREK